MPVHVVLLSILFLLSLPSQARIHELTISGDSRLAFHIESFGFNTNGVAEFDVKSFGVAPLPDEAVGWHMGFVFRKVSSESDAIANVEEATESGTCLLDDNSNKEGDTNKALADVRWEAPPHSKDWAAGWKHTHTIQPGEEGMYQIIFCRCKPSDATTTVSFDINLALYNIKGNSRDYLPAGESALPLLYFASAFVFAVMGGMWIYMCRTSKEFVHHIHLLMLMLVGLKMMSSLFHGVSFHFVKMYGHPVGWQIVYYIFTFLKGIMFFSVIMLVGTGWSLLKPYLNDREKKILLAVLPLQVLDNIALVVIEEMSPGSIAWLSWRDVLHLVDIICCCMILFPLVWQIRQLRLSTAVDGKVGLNIQKLTQYRNFYMAVVGYIYFTRIIVYLVGSTVPYYLTWFQSFAGECATVAFFVWTGWKFRPMSNNPYLPVQLDDDGEEVDEEFGLEDEEMDIELASRRTNASGTMEENEPTATI